MPTLYHFVSRLHLFPFLFLIYFIFRRWEGREGKGREGGDEEQKEEEGGRRKEEGAGRRGEQEEAEEDD